MNISEIVQQLFYSIKCAVCFVYPIFPTHKLYIRVHVLFIIVNSLWFCCSMVFSFELFSSIFILLHIIIVNTSQ